MTSRRTQPHVITDLYWPRTASDGDAARYARGYAAVDCRLRVDAARRDGDAAKANYYLYLAEANDAAALREERARYEQSREREQ